MLNSFTAGLLTALSLIVAIGAQNAFVLRQGLYRRHVALVIIVCVLSDILLISCGILGVGSLFQRHPLLQDLAHYGGAVFLLGYGLMAARRALSSEKLELAAGEDMTWQRVLLACLGFTYLNPHVYLDTVVLLGAVANQYHGNGPLWFGVGACVASLCWFLSLGFGARLLAPLFARERTWRVFDSGVSVMMLAMSYKLAFF
ncbi:MAG: amino acid transporter [Paludibacterium sp.]|uniref:LysE/ArgO family amino acid transporter n=1 Tax=Paludibacterium sp. TaxID=1917523 RepID=UPI0025DC2397|nr:LysE/ArgO family amino acid transporter [Paludibacterium sp.]MBV8047114.1 amino acid transporter [Paludibacterium sp.]MBV8649269.1 amino acid transporter [Paludibacterium sp.]